MSNPGGFRVELDAARAGGISDPRNTAIMRMFNLIGIGSNDGFGISNIFSVFDYNKILCHKFVKKLLRLFMTYSEKFGNFF